MERGAFTLCLGLALPLALLVLRGGDKRVRSQVAGERSASLDSGALSPSPRPSPPRRGGALARGLEVQTPFASTPRSRGSEQRTLEPSNACGCGRALDCPTSAQRFSLSSGERAGVRGKGARLWLDTRTTDGLALIFAFHRKQRGTAKKFHCAREARISDLSGIDARGAGFIPISRRFRTLFAPFLSASSAASQFGPVCSAASDHAHLAGLRFLSFG